MDWEGLQKAISDWDSYAFSNPLDAIRRIRQVGYLLQIEKADQFCFLPIRLLISQSHGVPFAQQGERSLNMRSHFESLAELGLGRVAETSPFFESVWSRYEQYCGDHGKPPACYMGDNPKTGRVFWVFPV